MRGRLRAAGALACGIIGITAAATPSWAASEQTTRWSITPGAGNRTIAVDEDTWRLAGESARHRSAESTQRIGTVVFVSKRLAHRVNAVEAQVDATIPDGSAAAVDVRGLRVDGTWSEWTEARPDRAAMLPEPTRAVQARLVLSAPNAAASPEVRAIDLTATRSAAAATDGVSALGAGLTYRIYATREGLVGGTTANGHVIVSRDHFVALPSRRGLAANNSGNYSVRVCKADNSRCEWAPVWDVGPWNTKDDYWNPSSTREMWRDLPQASPRRRPPTRTATTAAGTSSAAPCSTRPSSTWPTAPSGTA